MCHVRWRADAARIKNSPKRPAGFFQLLLFFFSLYHVLVLRVRDYPRIFQRRGKNRREKGERSRTKSISNLKINANARAKLEAKGVENRTGILHGSFANAFTFSRNTFELATQTAFCGLWSIVLKLALIPFGCRAAFSTHRR